MPVVENIIFLTLSYFLFSEPKCALQEILFFIRNQYSAIARKKSNTTAIITIGVKICIFSESVLNALPTQSEVCSLLVKSSLFKRLLLVRANNNFVRIRRADAGRYMFVFHADAVSAAV